MQSEFYKTLFFSKNFVILFRLELAEICHCQMTTLPIFWRGKAGESSTFLEHSV